MQFNLPVFEQLSSCKNILIAGMGGGFDIFCGLPIYFELRRRGLSVHLANYSFSMLTGLKDKVQLSPSLVGVTADLDAYLTYFPEGYMSRWFRDRLGLEVTVWAFAK